MSKPTIDEITKQKIEKNISINESSIIASLWKSPSLYAECDINLEDLSGDGGFYYELGNKMVKQGNVMFNEIAVYNVIGDNEPLKESFNAMGGWSTLKEMMSTVDVKNIDAYIDGFSKWKYIDFLHDKGFSVWKEFSKFEQMNAEQVYSYFEYVLNSKSISTVSGLKFESLHMTDDDIESLQQGMNVGLQYGKALPIMNYLTCGMPKGLSMIASFINEGKTSIAYESMVMPIADNGHKCLIISNEMDAMSLKYLMQVHILTNELNYWKLTRKKIKTGKYTEEDLAMMKKAAQIAKEKYTDTGLIQFLKVFDYSMDVVTKAIKMFHKLGGEFVLYDVLKSEDSVNDSVGHMIEASKDLFQLLDKLEMYGLCTMQLRMELKNRQRYLDLACLSTAKHATEPMSEVIMFRELWDDEIDPKSKDYCKPYRFVKDRKTGKFSSVKEEFELDSNKKYSVMFLNKSRNDSTGVTVLLEKDLAWNKWYEVGYCTIGSKNRY